MLRVNPPSDASFDTVVRRWPIILTTVIDHLHRMAHELGTQPHDPSSTVAEEWIKAGKAIIEKIGKIKYEMGRDKPLLYESINYSNVCPVHD
jgi:hypothetical protein